MRPQSMSTAIAALEAAGLVRGAPDPDDGRQTIMSLTDSCRERLRRPASLGDLSCASFSWSGRRGGLA